MTKQAERKAVVVQRYASDGDVRIFDGELMITIEGAKLRDVRSILRRFGYKLRRQWKHTDWGLEASAIRERKA